jgi:hypothetical protein
MPRKKLSDKLVQSVQSPKTGRLSPAEFGKLIAEETEKWGKVIRRPASRRSDGRTRAHVPITLFGEGRLREPSQCVN